MDKDKPGETTDPVGASFLAVVDILDHFSQHMPAAAGPQVREALDLIRTQWTPAPASAPAAPVPPRSEHSEQHARHHGHSQAE